MKESVRKCQFEQSWAECRRRLYREQEFKLKKSPRGFSTDEMCTNQASLKCGCYPAGLQEASHSNFPACSPRGISCYRSLNASKLHSFEISSQELQPAVHVMQDSLPRTLLGCRARGSWRNDRAGHPWDGAADEGVSGL